MTQIYGIPAFSDNYIWCIVDDKHKAIIIDPGCANTVDHFLTENNLNLVAILITHHHNDHIGGVKQLKTKYNPSIYGYKEANFDFLDYQVSDGDTFIAMNIEFKAIEVPGHTLDHIAFYSEISVEDEKSNVHLQPSLFCGDTLFSAGCGRLFEGSPEQMLNSLNKLSNLPTNTRIYCAHEYTLANLAFAKTLMPTNPQLASYISECEEKRLNGLPTIPTTLAKELEINPFLRHSDPEIHSSLKNKNLINNDTDLEIFRAVRKAKDSF